MASQNARSHMGGESEEPSMETTIPTDFTLSPESDEGKQSKLTLKQQLERKQLLHDLQLLKIELSHKSLVIDNLKAEYMAKIDDLEEKLADNQHQKQVLQARLESELKIQQETSKRRLNQTKQEMEAILKKQEQLEATNAKLQEKAGDIRRSLRDLELTEEQYYELKGQLTDQVSLRDYVAMKVYDIAWPIKTENEELRKRETRLREETKHGSQELSALKDELESTKQSLHEHIMKYNRATSELSNLKGQLNDVDYKRDTYDRVKIERDRFENELLNLKNTWSNVEASSVVLLKERDDYKEEADSMKRKVVLLQQDKDYLSKQVIELNAKASNTDERLSHTQTQLEHLKEAREELYERYVTARDKYKNEYEERLKSEIDGIRENMTSELDKLKTAQHHIHEMELRALREARDMAAAQREKAEAQLNELKSNYDELRVELKQMQATDDAKLTDLRSELKMKNLELERARLMESEVTRNYRDLQVETEKFQKKVEILTNELYEQQNKYEKRITALETKLSETSVRLETYEKLEQDLDDIVLHAAEIGDDLEAERVLFSFGYGANVPTTAKRRLQQSLHLARRILAVEKANSSLVQHLEAEKDKLKQLSEELANANELLSNVQQPYNYMIDSIRLKDDQMAQMRKSISALQTELTKREQEREYLIKSRTQMSQDLEHLLNQIQEFKIIKQHLLKMQSSKDMQEYESDVASPENIRGVSPPEKKLPSAIVFTKFSPPVRKKS